MVRELEDPVGVDGFDVLAGSPVQRSLQIRLEPAQDGLADLVVRERAPVRLLVHPDDVPPARFGQRDGHGRRAQTGEINRQADIELLAQHGAGRQERHRVGPEEVEAAPEEECRLLRGLHRAHFLVADDPLTAAVLESARLDHAAQHRRGHERAPFRQTSGGIQRDRRQAPGHRLAERPHVAVGERRQGVDRQGRQGPERVAGPNLLGSEGDHDQERAGMTTAELAPPAQESNRQRVAPLAVVEEDDRGPRRGAEPAEQGEDRVDAARFAERFGADHAVITHDGEKAGERGRDRCTAVAHRVEQARQQVVVARGQNRFHDTAEELERTRCGLVHSLAAKDPGSETRGFDCELVEQPRLAPARLRLDDHEPGPAAHHRLEPMPQRRHLVGSPDERGLAQRQVPVVHARGELRLDDAAVELGCDGGEVEPDRPRGLVPLVGVLAEQSLDDLVEGAGDIGSDAPHPRRPRADVVMQDLAHRRAGGGWPACHRLEQQDTEGVEVGSLVDRRVEEARRFGSQIAHRAHQLVANGGAEQGAVGEPEVDQLGALGTGLHGDDDVGRLHVAMQHAGLVRGLQCRGDIHADPEDRAHGQLVEQERAQRGALVVRLHDAEQVAVLAARDHRPHRRGSEHLEDLGLVLEPEANRCRRRVGSDQLDDDGRAIGARPPEMGLDPAPSLEQAVQDIAPIQD